MTISKRKHRIESCSRVKEVLHLQAQIGLKWNEAGWTIPLKIVNLTPNWCLQ